MITLNNINLSSIDLLGIDLRGIKLGLGGRGSGSGDGFPVLPGDVTRWHFGGLTNEMMAAMDDPRLEDADGKGRFLSFKNFAWSGMSGAGGYVENYNRWTKSAVRADITFTDHSFNVTSVKINQAQFYYQSSGGEQPFTVPSGTVIVKGLTDGQVLEYIYTDIEGRHVFTVKNDGIYTLPSFEFSAKGNYYGFQFNKVQESCNITIEQLPLYPGFILGDGVDDFAVTEKELNFEDTYTVYTAFIPFETPIKYPALCGKDYKKDFYINYIGDDLSNASFYSSNKSIYIPILNGFNILCCKRTPDKIVIKNLITGMLSEVSVDALIDNPGLYYLWVSLVAKNYAKAAIAGQIIDNGHFATDEEDAKVLSWYKKEYPWLFFDQAWTVTGKTNEDADRDTIANITGNGNDLVLSNFGFAEGSGYGLYGVSFDKWRIEKDVNVTASKDSIHAVLSSIKTTNLTLFFRLFAAGTTDAVVNSFKIKVSGLVDGQTLLYNSIIGSNINTVFTIDKDGVYQLPSIQGFGGGDYYGFAFTKVQESCNITIEQIPEYKGYLITDGVDDKITSSAFEMGKDWTVVGDWKLINDESKNAGIIKPSSLYVYNASNGVSIFINSGSIGNNIKENKGFNAICSDGRAYDRNWTEYSELKVEEVTKSNSELKIGASSNDTTYTRMAFKNFAIYPKVLSKDDCIKAYNYLQTLKAK